MPFLEFKPISSASKEEIIAYYKDNNIPLDDTPQFRAFLGVPLTDPPETIVQPGTTITIGQGIPAQKTSPIKENIWAPFYAGKSIKPEEKKSSWTPPSNMNEIQKEIYSLDIPDEEKQYLDTLSYGESTHKPYITNTLGYYGLYQFGDSAFKELNLSKEDFKDTKVQHQAALDLAKRNEQYLQNYLKRHKVPEKSIEDLIGKKVNGVTLTRNGIRAAMHHQGALTFFDWLYGTEYSPISKKGFKDSYGASITRYLERFDT